MFVPSSSLPLELELVKPSRLYRRLVVVMIHSEHLSGPQSSVNFIICSEPTLELVTTQTEDIMRSLTVSHNVSVSVT